MTSYEVYLKITRGIVPVEADKFECEPGYTVFYSKNPETEKFEEVTRFSTANVADIKVAVTSPPALLKKYKR